MQLCMKSMQAASDERTSVCDQRIVKLEVSQARILVLDIRVFRQGIVYLVAGWKEQLGWSGTN